MAIQDKNTLKSYFETGDKPTQQQFADLIDSMAHFDSTNPEHWFDCDTSITSLDKNKAVMFGTDGKLKLYETTPEHEGVKGKWDITVLTITISGNNPYIQYETKDETVYFDINAWRNGNTPQDTTEEAGMIASYINNNYSDLLSASSSGSVVTIEEVEALGVNLNVYDDTNMYSVSTINSPDAFIPEMSDSIFIGLIKNIDETAHKCSLFDSYIIEGIAAEDIDIVSRLTSEEDIERMLGLIVMPANGGLVRLINQDDFFSGQGEDDMDFPMSILGAVGIALTSALQGEKIKIKQLK